MKSQRISRRSFLMWSAATAGVGALTACAGAPVPAQTPAEQPAEQPAEAAEPTEAAAPAPAAAGAAIEYFSYDLGPANESREQIAKKFTELNPDIAVTNTFLPYGDNWNKLSALMAAGTPPDVIYADFSLVNHALEGNLLDLQPYFDSDAAFTKKDDFTIDLLDPVMAKYGTQQLYNLLLGTWVPILYYNSDLFDAAGEAYPTAEWTIDDVRAAARKLTTADGEQWGLQWGTILDQTGWFWWLQQPADFWASPQSYPDKTTWDSAEGLAVMEMYKAMGADDKTAVPFELMGGFQTFGAAFGAGKSAMVIGGDWDAGWGYRDLPFKWGMTLIPMMKPGYRPNLNTMQSGNTVAAGTKNKDAAWQYARFMAADEAAQTYIGAGAYETPVLKKVAQSEAVMNPEWAAPGYASRVEAAMIPGVSYCPYPLSVNLWEFPDKYLNPTVTQVTTGEMSPQEAVAYLDKEGTPYFQQLKSSMPKPQS